MNTIAELVPRPRRRRRTSACASRTRRGRTPSCSTRRAQRAAFLLDAQAGRRAVPRRRAARQRARVLDHARRVPRCRGATLVGHQPDPPRRRAGPRRAAHRLRAADHRADAPRAARGRGRRRAGRRVLRRSTTPEWDDALAPYAGAPLPDVEVAPARHVHADLHVGHDRRAEGRADEPRQAARRGARTSRAASRSPPDDVCYSVDAAVPLERGGRRLHRTDGGRRDHGAAPPVLGERLPARRAQVRRDVLQLRRQAAHVHPRHARAARRRRQPAAASRSATRPRRSTSTASRSASAASSSTATARPRAASTCAKTDDTPPGSLGMPVPGFRRRDPRSRDRRGVRRRAVRRARPAAQRRGGDRRDGEPRRRGRLRGLLQQPRSQRRAHARRHVLDRRPRLPRRRRASSTSRAATPTGCASTARTSRPRRSSRSSRATPTSCSPRCTRCRRPKSATR